MKILEHRGGWCNSFDVFDCKTLQNTKQSFINSLKRGNGIETDLRYDAKGSIVIAHDLPSGDEISFDELLQMYCDFSRPSTLALNIKTDGIQREIALLLRKYNITDFFTFDMSFPEHLYYIACDLKPMMRQSEFEFVNLDNGNPVYQQSAGLWVDQFTNPITGLHELTGIQVNIADQLLAVNSNDLVMHLDNKKIVSIVSSELHAWGRNFQSPLYLEVWAELKLILLELKKIDYNSSMIYLCTDLPIEAEVFFNDVA
jgi:hypothetical protein